MALKDARIFELQQQLENYADAMALKDARIFELLEQLERLAEPLPIKLLRRLAAGQRATAMVVGRRTN
jgi:hypothetical protein